MIDSEDILTITRLGWKIGEPPYDDKYRLAFVWYWPLHPNENREGSFPTFDGGYLRDGSFMRTDGWIGWRCICVCYHPNPVIAVGDEGPYFVNSSRWDDQVESTL